MGNLSKTRVSSHSAKAELPQKKVQENEITLQMLKDAIPAECFESSVPRSFSYLIRDLIYVAILVYLALHIDSFENQNVRYALWTLYTVVQGFVFTGLWIIGHECGHGAFSKYPLLNNIVGWAVHSGLSVPYFSWQITHARHHRYHSNMEKDVVFVPHTEGQVEERKKASRWYALMDLFEDTPAYTLIQLLGHQLVGWQLYLFLNVTRGKKSLPQNGRKARFLYNESHFDPFSALFTPSQRKLIFMTDIGLLTTAGLLTLAGNKIGFNKIVLLYIIPYFWVHHWLVAITYLHHTHPSVPHYTDERWNFTDGALCTIDRSIGFIGRHFFHEIIDYHVVHHLFPRIPFYEAEKATKAIIPLLGQRYVEEKEEPFLMQLYNTFRQCQFVTEVENSGVLHWVIPKLKA